MMADGNRITLVIEGLPEDDGRVRFKTFLDQLQHLNASISRLDREVNDGKPALDFQIAELSYSSPIRVSLEPRESLNSGVIADALLESFERIADAIEGDGDLSQIDADILSDFRALAKPVGKQVKTATLLFDGGQLSLTERIYQRTDEALAVTDEGDGMFEGMLEQINVHGGANTFHIYPEIGPRKLTCNFPAALYDDAVAAVGKRVEITGVLKYRSGADFPHMVSVTGIDIFPNEEDLPDWDDLRGIAPQATGDQKSEEFVRELRDVWV